MEYGAIDLHARKTLIRIVDADGAVILDRTITTTREGLTQVFGGRARMRVLLETGTESEWVAQAIEAAGHEAVVADPNYALMYGVTVRAVTDACSRGEYPPITSTASCIAERTAGASGPNAAQFR